MSSPSFSVVLFTAPPPGQPSAADGSTVRVDGRETLLRTVELFLNRDAIQQIIVVFDPSSVEEARSKFGGHFGFSGVKLASGGPNWIAQLIAAKEKISAEATHVLIHDAARPAVPFSDLDELIEASTKHSAIVSMQSLRSGLIELDEGGEPVAIESSTRFASLITPFAFSRKLFDEMCRDKALPHASKLHLVAGSSMNVRVGSGNDAAIAKAMLNLLPKPKAKAASPFEEAQW